MPERQIDPARLEGEALRRWYLRSPDEIEQERRASQDQRYQTFFGANQSRSEDAGSSPAPTRQMAALDEDVLWIANGRDGYRAVRRGADDFQATLQPAQDAGYPEYLPYHSATGEGGEFTAVGNPNNRRLKKAYIKEHGSWPVTEDGRSYHVHHIDPTSRGGAQTLDNIKPMHPDEHVAHHSGNGDFKAWGAMSGGGRKPAAPPSQSTPPRAGAEPARPSIAEARVARVAGTPSARIPRLAGKLGILGILSDALGVASGRIRVRTDTWDNYRADMLGEPSLEDRRKAAEGLQRLINPNWKPGDPFVA